MKKEIYGFLGPRGTFSEEAAMLYCNEEDELVPLPSFNEIFESLKTGEITKGVIPVENSLEGSVNLCMDLLYTSSFVEVVGEIVLPVKQYLMAPRGMKIRDIEELYSISQVIGQSSNYINEYLPDAEIYYTASSAQAAEFVKEEEGRALIGSRRLSELYDLEILAEEIQDGSNNYTRFFVIANQLDVENGFPELDKEYKTSIICAPIVNKAGVLYSILGDFKREEINLTRIESRPSKRQLGEYIFYIDMEGHQKNRHVRIALEGVKQKSSFFRILGSYVRGDLLFK
ncbi:MAG: prephenate dehydratase [Halanaerobiaceae bacterium]|nr:prephenate dehydratase [Halanaerobiaceae bacterium]